MCGCAGEAGRPACRAPALRAAILGALSTATEHLTAPRHLRPLLYLSTLAQVIVQGVLCTCLANHQQYVQNPVDAGGVHSLLLLVADAALTGSVSKTMKTFCLDALQTAPPTRRPLP